MSYSTIVQLYSLALYLLFPLGCILGLYVTFRVLIRSLKKNPPRSISEAVGTALIKGSPGVLLIILFAIPAIYMGHQLKQHNYCVDVVAINDIRVAEEHPVFMERCGDYDTAELIHRGQERARTTQSRPVPGLETHLFPEQ